MLKEDMELLVSVVENQRPKEYRQILTLDSNGKAIHQTAKISGKLLYFLFRTSSVNELDITVKPVEFPDFIFHISTFKNFGVYPWKVLSVSSEGEQITAPSEWSSVALNDVLEVVISGGQEGSTVDTVIRYE